MFEYKVVPAPVKGLKAKGVKGAEARFALAVEQAINALAADGWDYVRTDVLPSEERVGLTGSVTNWRNLMVFRRGLAVEAAPEAEVVLARMEPVLTAPAVAAVPEGDGVAEDHPQSDALAKQADDADFEEGPEETRPA
ncbi:DUF4177 domain-containing protein [Marivita hallyeonensis]|uniref:DUF4177 domain-containing protein n=1 Tax=Marivita hallyeonensis TaxID=996342 RepID=A0A1M5W352_9RHOB|nr:DUF4177 domain-containing protein [Marivita hallyeonensis]SHH81634.1 protein of unknown function [Marivita hallyeonensis]